MTIKSMTAFARELQQGEWGTIAWDIRAVNHRYLDLSFSLPEGFKALEETLRERIRRYLQRGKLDFNLYYQSYEFVQTQLELNKPLLKQLIALGREVEILSPTLAPLTVADLLRWPQLVNSQPVNNEKVYSVVLEAFETAMQSLGMAREREGHALKVFLQRHIDACRNQTDLLRNQLPAILTRQRQKLTARIREHTSVPLEAIRFEQEIVLLTQKYDITEELERLEIHIQEVLRLLSQGGVVGRRLDFLMQEMQREANTLSSKANDIQLTEIAVELKVLIEQMREQIQNIE